MGVHVDPLRYIQNMGGVRLPIYQVVFSSKEDTEKFKAAFPYLPMQIDELNGKWCVTFSDTANELDLLIMKHNGVIVDGIRTCLFMNPLDIFKFEMELDKDKYLSNVDGDIVTVGYKE